MLLLSANAQVQAQQYAGSNQPAQMDVGSLCAPTWRAGASIAASGIVQPTSPNETGFWYKTSAEGQTGALEPAWPTTSGGTVTDGSITWTAGAPLVSGADSVASAAWTQSNSGGGAALTIADTSTTDRLASAQIGGGTSGVLYTVTCTVTMTSGAIYKGVLLLTVL